MDSAPGRRMLFHKGSPSRNKVYFVVGGLILIGVSLTFARSTYEALSIRAHTSSEFSQYIIDHHIGTVQESSDVTGFQGDFSVLYLNDPLQQSNLKSSILNLLHEYHSLDGGSNLTIDYSKSPTDKLLFVADAVYDDTSQTVSIITHSSGDTNVEKVHVDWSSDWYSN